MGKAMVVHALASGARIACGIIGAETAIDFFAGQPDVEVEELVPYPGSGWTFGGLLPMHASLTIEGERGTSKTARQNLRWRMTGLDPACAKGAADGVKNGCGIHVHRGTSCKSADDVGGHYYSDALTADPWADVRYAVESGDMGLEFSGVRVKTGNSNGDITGRVIVVHDHTGSRIGCGVIKRSAPCLQAPPPPLGSDRGRCHKITNATECEKSSESGCPCVMSGGFFPSCERVCPGDGTGCEAESGDHTARFHEASRHCCETHRLGKPKRWCSWDPDRGGVCSERHLD